MKHYMYILTFAVVANFQLANATDYLPMFEPDKEWGYVSYGADPLHNNEDMPNFYRVGTANTKKIGSENYYTLDFCIRFMALYNYDRAYIREDNGKVFIRYNENAGLDANNYYSPGREYLVYDFTLKPGESCSLTPRSEGEECIVLKCVETGTVDTPEGQRRYLKFDRNVNETTKKWMAYEYLVEGIGPVGDCDIITPYRLHGTAEDGSKMKETDLLYKRFKGIGDDDDSGQGVIVYTTPAFEVWGVHDPSVWCVPTRASMLSSVKTPSLPELPCDKIRLNLSEDGGTVTASDGEVLIEVTVFDLLGKVLGTYRPHSNEFKVDCGRFDASIVIVRASTASGSRSFKLAL